MADSQLQEGISILYDMEKNNYLMTRAIANLDQRIRGLGYNRKISAPSKRKTGGISGVFGDAIAIGYIGAILCGIIGLIVGAIALWVDSMNIIVKIIFGLFIIGVYGVIGAVIGAVVAGIGGLIFSIIKEKKDKENSEAQYDRNLELYQKKLRIDKARVDAELREKKILIEQRDSLILRLQDAKYKLVKFYDLQTNLHLLPYADFF